MTTKRRRKKMQRKQRRAAREAEQDVFDGDLIDEDGLCAECRAIEEAEEADFWLADLMSQVTVELHEVGLTATMPESLKDNLLVRDLLVEANRNRTRQSPVWEEWVSKYGLDGAEQRLDQLKIEIELVRE